MSPTSVVTEDKIVSLKVAYNDSNRRFKLMLAEITPTILDKRIREFLFIPSHHEITIERYSDSARAYVTLDASNLSVSRQLYRAAKAKGKLKLRVTEKELAVENRAETVDEDTIISEEIDGSSSSKQREADAPHAEVQSNIRIISTSVPPATAPSDLPILPPMNQVCFNSLVESFTALPTPASVWSSLPPKLPSPDETNQLPICQDSQKSFCSTEAVESADEPKEKAIEENETSKNAELETFQEKSTETPLLDLETSDVDKGTEESAKDTTEKRYVSSAPMGIARDQLQVVCNSCRKIAENDHYHCSICDNDDFDLCLDCIRLGITCYNHQHWLIRRSKKNGIYINSTTETIAPKKQTFTSLPPTQETASASSATSSDKEKPTQERLATRKEPVPDNSRIETSTGLSALTSTPVGASGMPLSRSTSQDSSNASTPSEFPKDASREEFKGTSKDSAEASKDTSKKKSSSDNDKKKVPKLSPPVPVVTCNGCLCKFPTTHVVKCETCTSDIRICLICLVESKHGHHPGHRFVMVTEPARIPPVVHPKLEPGRNYAHNAICDQCDKFIVGVRYKCLVCPDWDHCAKCHEGAKTTHHGHRFVPMYANFEDDAATASNTAAVHAGVICDGPLCRNKRSYISGDRYKCAICNDVDFCQNCEAHPHNKHNITHPMIKFQTPVRQATIVAYTDLLGADGKPLGRVGDSSVSGSFAMGEIRTVANVQPVPPMESPKPVMVEEEKEEKEKKKKKKMEIEEQQPLVGPILDCKLEEHTLTETTTCPPDTLMEQTWTLRNTGNMEWPSNTCIRFVGGDYMGVVNRSRPVIVGELEAALRSNPSTVVPCGGVFPFRVLLRSPSVPGKYMSMWQLMNPGGDLFGSTFTCKMEVIAPVMPSVAATSAKERESTMKVSEKAESTETKTAEADVKTEVKEEAVAKSAMIFPKLEKESPMSSMHQNGDTSLALDASVEETENGAAEFEDCDLDDRWDDDDFLTDEEYDILDASDEDFVQQQKKA